MNPPLPDRITRLLTEHRTMVLATAGPDAQPEAAGVFFAPALAGARPELVCALLSSSAKLGQIRANPAVGFFIGPLQPTIWLQGTGIARVVQDAHQRADCVDRLLAHAPDAAVFIERVPVTGVVIAVRTLKLTDLTGGKPPVLALSFD